VHWACESGVQKARLGLGSHCAGCVGQLVLGLWGKLLRPASKLVPGSIKKPGCDSGGAVEEKAALSIQPGPLG